MANAEATTKGKSPVVGFLYMAIGNFLGMIVFAIVYFILKDEAGDPYPIILVLSGVLLLAAIASLVMFIRFSARYNETRTGGPAA